MHTGAGFILLMISSICFLLSYAGIIFKPRMLFPRVAALGGVGALSGSFAVLASACAGKNYSFQYVYDNVSNNLSLAYRFSAAWAGQEGSFLLWAVMTGIICVPLLVRGRGRGISVIPLFLFMMTVSMLIFSDPFRAAGTAWHDGRGLNAVLLNPWMIVHPPLLFAGYACSLPLFASAFSALSKNAWVESLSSARIYAFIGACLILCGIFTGAFWAYETLGWGGFWGWDPVENGALVPLILSVALILRIDSENEFLRSDRTGMFVASSVFISVMLSVYMTRSGILADSSVHSFSRSSLGTPIAVMCVFAVCLPIVAVWYGRRYDALIPIVMNARERILSWISSFLAMFAAVVFFFTVFPVAAGIVTGDSYSLRENIFNDLSLPVAAVLLAAIGISRVTSVSRASSRMLVVGAFVSVVVSLAVIVLSGGGPWITALAIFAATAFVSCVIHLIKRKRPALTGFLFYGGFSLFVIGVVASSQGPSARIELHRGTPVAWHGMTFEYVGMTTGKERSFVIRMTESGSEDAGLIPVVPSSEGVPGAGAPLIFRTLSKDCYISAEGYISAGDMDRVHRDGEKKSDGQKDALRWETLLLNVSLKPMMILVWCGMIMSAAGLAWGAVSGRRLR